MKTIVGFTIVALLFSCTTEEIPVNTQIRMVLLDGKPFYKFTFNSNGQIASFQLYNNAGILDEIYQYTWVDNTLTKALHTSGLTQKNSVSLSETYTYTPSGRLTTVTVADATTHEEQTIVHFIYDGQGHLDRKDYYKPGGVYAESLEVSVENDNIRECGTAAWQYDASTNPFSLLQIPNPPDMTWLSKNNPTQMFVGGGAAALKVQDFSYTAYFQSGTPLLAKLKSADGKEQVVEYLY